MLVALLDVGASWLAGSACLMAAILLFRATGRYLR